MPLAEEELSLKQFLVGFALFMSYNCMPSCCQFCIVLFATISAKKMLFSLSLSHFMFYLYLFMHTGVKHNFYIR